MFKKVLRIIIIALGFMDASIAVSSSGLPCLPAIPPLDLGGSVLETQSSVPPKKTQEKALDDEMQRQNTVDYLKDIFPTKDENSLDVKAERMAQRLDRSMLLRRCAHEDMVKLAQDKNFCALWNVLAQGKPLSWEVGDAVYAALKSVPCDQSVCQKISEHSCQPMLCEVCALKATVVLRKFCEPDEVGYIVTTNLDMLKSGNRILGLIPSWSILQKFKREEAKAVSAAQELQALEVRRFQELVDRTDN